MKERPILFSAPMVRAILDGTKTQTRRIMKPQPTVSEDGWFSWNGHAPNSPYGAYAASHIDKESLRLFVGPSSPYGKPGDHLWVRETWGLEVRNYGGGTGEFYTYRATNPDAVYCKCADGTSIPIKWKPSIHMPRKASRILLEVISVRVERLQDMEGQAPYPGESDALAEGVNRIHHGHGEHYYSAFHAEPHPKNWCDPNDAFRELWESINGAGSWAENPWVWVVEFKRIEPGAA